MIDIAVLTITVPSRQEMGGDGKSNPLHVFLGVGKQMTSGSPGHKGGAMYAGNIDPSLSHSTAKG
jgi:hypothetical protein